MTASELRIGNYALKTKTGEVYPLSGNDIVNFEHSNLMQPMFQPIPLSEEWLLKFGFEPSGSASGVMYSKTINGGVIRWFDDASISLSCAGEDKGYACCPDALIEHVHQLQNLYFALTGEELKLKEGK